MTDDPAAGYGSTGHPVSGRRADAHSAPPALPRDRLGPACPRAHARTRAVAALGSAACRGCYAEQGPLLGEDRCEGSQDPCGAEIVGRDARSMTSAGRSSGAHDCRRWRSRCRSSRDARRARGRRRRLSHPRTHREAWNGWGNENPEVKRAPTALDALISGPPTTYTARLRLQTG
jgi:hypothetical protein